MTRSRRRSSRLRAVIPALAAAALLAACGSAAPAAEPVVSGFRRSLDLLPVADRTPAHHRVLLDTTGRLWVSRWSPWPRQLGTDWWVFDADGWMIATAEMPEGVFVLGIGEDEVLGTVQDEVGVEYLVGMGVR